MTLSHPFIPFRCYWCLRQRVKTGARRVSHRPVLLLAVVTGLLLGGPLGVHAADVILLKNGDRVSGTILLMEDTVLTVDTDYADVIKIDWDDVDGLISEKPL